MSIGALGVAYGDIGTSVLYAFKECLHHGISTNKEIIGVLSLIIWSLTILVTGKYISIVTRANNQGEGGILALLSLAFPKCAKPSGLAATGMIAVGIAGAALLYGDGVITPAISVISAVEGLLIATDAIKPFIIPLTLGILVGLFALQSRGTAELGKWFGRIMLVWFTTLAVLGVYQIAQHPGVLWALNPLEGIHFLLHHGVAGLIIMGSVFLVVTGGESLYADLGHFGRPAIARAWAFLVCPALMLNYLGQGALALSHPESRDNPFFHMGPDWVLYPLVFLAMTATVIASQALISGVFSLTMQGIQMGYIPRMEIRHTSKDEHGQIYIPKINAMLGIGCALLVVGFGTSSALASAYGVAVTLTMLSTTVLFYFASQRIWNWSPLRAGIVCLIFGTLEAIFFAANSLKILHGGWFPLVFGAFVFIIMVTWKDGRALLRKQLPVGMSLEDFIASISIAGALDEQNKLHRSQGTAIFLAGNPDGTPNALVKNIKHNQILHQRNILLTITTDNGRPHVPLEERVQIDRQPEGFFRVLASFGFMETPHIEEVLRAANAAGLEIQSERATFFVGRERIVVTGKGGMAEWREHIFVFLSKHSENAADFFQLPPDRVYEVSQVVEI
ncbi:MAG TPA: potassium transporter Kup [Terrimicrobiaceae bacterium]|nr:potassium transporter Kup [Terrimicrobiaceae bacterium]